MKVEIRLIFIGFCHWEDKLMPLLEKRIRCNNCGYETIFEGLSEKELIGVSIYCPGCNKNPVHSGEKDDGVYIFSGDEN